MSPRQRGRLAFMGLCVLLSGLIFVLDLSLPLGVVAAVPHAAVVLLSVALDLPLFTFALAGLATLLTVAVIGLDPVAAVDLGLVLTNRLLSLSTIWVTAILGLLLTRERRRRSLADEELRESLERSRAILETAIDSFVTIDKRGKIQAVNPAAERMFGYSAAELLGENVKVLMPAPWHEEHDGYLVRYRETGERRIIGIGREVMGRRKDGSTFPLELAVSEAKVGGERLFFGTLRDVSERRRLEEQFLQAQKMEAVGRLAGGVAHDFNTLLASILGYSEMLLDALPEHGKLRRSAEQIQRSADRGATLTRQLLTFSRPQVRERSLVDLNDVIRGASEMLDRLVGEKVELAVELQEDLALVQADAAQMERVVVNLVVNAADAITPGDGRIVISTANAPSTAAGEPAGSEGATVHLAVADNGSGMDEATRRRIFEPFFTTKQKGKGTGLGLSTVYAIVHQNGGSVSAVSARGEGSSFHVVLPRAASARGVEPEPAGGEDEAAGPLPKGSETILLVEDDAMFRGLLEEVLESHGYTVVAAAEPAEALERVASLEGTPALVVTDLVMPGLTGDELARRLVKLYPSVRVILMSGDSDESLEERIAADLDLPILRKPFSTKDLVRQVRRALDSEPGDR